MEKHLKIIGVLLIGLACLHTVFPRRFDWAKDLSPLTLLNRQMMYVHTFFIALVVFLMGLLCLTSPYELTSTRLGSRVVLGFAIFWCIRLVIQFWGYSADLWRGKRFETIVHVLFSVLWLYLTIVFAVIYYNGINTTE